MGMIEPGASAVKNLPNLTDILPNFLPDMKTVFPSFFPETEIICLHRGHVRWNMDNKLELHTLTMYLQMAEKMCIRHSLRTENAVTCK